MAQSTSLREKQIHLEGEVISLSHQLTDARSAYNKVNQRCLTLFPRSSHHLAACRQSKEMIRQDQEEKENMRNLISRLEKDLISSKEEVVYSLADNFRRDWMT